MPDRGLSPRADAALTRVLFLPFSLVLGWWLAREQGMQRTGWVSCIERSQVIFDEA
jgi:hypothetical protein